jgi:hypothetical protein
LRDVGRFSTTVVAHGAQGIAIACAPSLLHGLQAMTRFGHLHAPYVRFRELAQVGREVRIVPELSVALTDEERVPLLDMVLLSTHTSRCQPSPMSSRNGSSGCSGSSDSSHAPTTHLAATFSGTFMSSSPRSSTSVAGSSLAHAADPITTTRNESASTRSLERTNPSPTLGDCARLSERQLAAVTPA